MSSWWLDGAGCPLWSGPQSVGRSFFSVFPCREGWTPTHSRARGLTVSAVLERHQSSSNKNREKSEMIFCWLAGTRAHCPHFTTFSKCPFIERLKRVLPAGFTPASAALGESCNFGLFPWIKIPVKKPCAGIRSIQLSALVRMVLPYKSWLSSSTTGAEGHRKSPGKDCGLAGRAVLCRARRLSSGRKSGLF